jgi:hypothetical protein
MDKKIMELTNCLMAQHFESDEFLDFRDLAGFQMFCDSFLTPMEREKFIYNTKMLFGRKKKDQLAGYMMCGDDLLSSGDYLDILGTRNARKCNKKRNETFNDIARKNVADNNESERYQVKVKRNNPVLHWKACGEKRIILIDLEASTSKKAAKIYKTMVNHYVTNVNEILKCILLFVEKSADGKYRLQNITSEKLNSIQKQIKRLVAKFYLQSIGDFHALLYEAQNIPHYNLSEQDAKASNRKRKA